MTNGQPDDAWADDPANAWGAAPPEWTPPPPAPAEPDTGGWRIPRQSSPPYPHPVSPFPISHQNGFPPPEPAERPYPHREPPGGYPTQGGLETPVGGYGQRGYGAPGYGAPVHGTSGYVPERDPQQRESPYAAQNYAPPSYSTDPEPSHGAGTRTGVSTWTAPQPPARRITHDEGELTRRGRRQSTYGDEPAYGAVLAFTSAWFGVPTALYLLWLVTLDSARAASVGRSFVASMPWLLAAIVVSLVVASLLRWATVGWRTFALSFASAVIGAGVTTIAHSLTI